MKDYVASLSPSQRAELIQLYGKNFQMKAAAAVWKTKGAAEKAEWNRRAAATA